MSIITASEGKVFKRLHDGFIMGSSINLGVDFSTGVARQDSPNYYEEIDDPAPPEPTAEEMKEALNILGVEV